jgi:hypothetical protein
MSEIVKMVFGVTFLCWFAREFRRWFGGSWSVRRGLMFRIGGAILGALAPASAVIGIPVGYAAGVLGSLAYNIRYEE